MKLRLTIIMFLLIFGSIVQAQHCQSTTTPIDPTIEYNCNQYVRAALIQGIVNTTNGVPTATIDLMTTSDTPIKSGNDFIKVGNSAYAQALSINNVGDHSVLILDGGFSGTTGYFASTPGADCPLYLHYDVSFSTGSSSYDMYAITKGFKITGPSTIQEGQQAIFTFDDGDNPVYSQITNIDWDIDETYLQAIDSTDTSITVKALDTTYPDSVHLSAILSTSAIDVENGDHRPVISTYAKITSNCTGTLNGSYLSTFNTISANTAYVIDMNVGSYNWTKTSGNTNYYYTSDSNNKLHFSVASGCTTFTATRNGCSLTFIFCAYGGYSMSSMESIPSESVSYSIIDLSTGQEIRNGCVNKIDVDELSIGLPTGKYVLNVNGKRQQIVVKN